MNSETAESALRADTQNALRVLAEETSGTLIGNTNDLGPRLVERVTSDFESYYEIGYVPPLAADGHFRSIAVKLSRSGLTVHSRSGYFALPDTDTTPLMPSELPMLAALATEPPPHPFDYSLAAFRFDQSARGVQHMLIVEVPLDRLTFQEIAAPAPTHFASRRWRSSRIPPAGSCSASASRTARGAARPRACPPARSHQVQATVLAAARPLHRMDDRPRSGDGTIECQVVAARRA